MLTAREGRCACWALLCFFLGGFCIAVTPQRCVAAELTKEQALDMLEAAVGSVRSYDVHLRVTRRWVAKAAVVGKRRIGSELRDEYEWRTLEPGEAGHVDTASYRQVRDRLGRRRVEKLQETGQIHTITAFDGEILRILNPGQNSGLIDSEPGLYVEQGADYLTYYATAFGETSLADLFRGRESTIVKDDPSMPEAVVIHCEPEKGSGDLPDFGFTVWLDPSRGMFPKRMLLMRFALALGHQRPVPFRESVVKKFHECEPGVWAPLEILTTEFAATGEMQGSPTSVCETLVELDRSQWNQRLQDELFTLAFPPGTTVTDRLRNVRFVTGNPNPESNLEELAKHAKEEMPVARTLAAEVIEGPWLSTPRAIFLLANILLLAIVAGVFIWLKSSR